MFFVWRNLSRNCEILGYGSRELKYNLYRCITIDISSSVELRSTTGFGSKIALIVWPVIASTEAEFLIIVTPSKLSEQKRKRTVKVPRGVAPATCHNSEGRGLESPTSARYSILRNNEVFL